MTKSIYERRVESFIFNFFDREGKRIIKDSAMTIDKIQDDFKKSILKMRPGDIRVFQEIKLSSISKENVSYKTDVGAAFVDFCKARSLDSYQMSSIYKDVSGLYNSASLRYDFLVCKMNNSGKLQMTAIEVNGPQHYFGTGTTFANQIKRDIAKLIMSHRLGVKFIEIDASCGISPAGYELIEKELKKFGAKKV